MASGLRADPVVPGGSVGDRMDAAIARLEKAGLLPATSSNAFKSSVIKLNAIR